VSFTLIEERMKVFNRVLQKIAIPQRDEVTQDWRKLYNEEFHNLYSSSNIMHVIKSRRIR
jgi:hypothetical protein